MENQTHIKKLTQVSEAQIEQAITVFIDGFSHMFSFATKEELRELFKDSFHKEMIYVYIDGSEVVGFLGLGNNKKRPLTFSDSTCKRLFGKVKGYIVYKQLQSLLAKPSVEREDELLIDHLTTLSKARGKGVATALIEFACSTPNKKYICLEVLSKNIKAKRLYEKVGFEIYKKQFSVTLALQRVGQPLKMRKTV